ncbi:MAG: ATP-binding cassette domain-containing protein [Eubacteriales bacterium]
MIRFENVSKVYSLKDKKIYALQDINFTIEQGEICGVIGTSGAGKSTLVRCMNLLERPTIGKVFLNEIELTAISENELRKARKKIGMIFQQFNLLEQRTALKNVCYPLEIMGMHKKMAEEKAKELLHLVGLEDRMSSYPSQLSGGQKQRVAIARALATDPEILLCDEATSALDPSTTQSILELLKKINETMGMTIIMITHEMKIVDEICNRVLVVEEGRLVEGGFQDDCQSDHTINDQWNHRDNRNGTDFNQSSLCTGNTNGNHIVHNFQRRTM